MMNDTRMIDTMMIDTMMIDTMMIVTMMIDYADKYRFEHHVSPIKKIKVTDYLQVHVIRGMNTSIQELMMVELMLSMRRISMLLMLMMVVMTLAHLYV